MRIARWYYVQEPVFPPHEEGQLGLFHHPALIEQLLKIVRENPGLTVGDIADRMGKADHYVETVLWRLKKHTGSLRIEVTGYERTPGLEEFKKVPSVQRMASKLASCAAPSLGVTGFMTTISERQRACRP